MNRTKKAIICLLVSVSFIFCNSSFLSAWEVYENYTYSFYGKPYAEPQAFIPNQTVTGEKSGTTAFNSPKDIFADESGNIYVADTGNNRIVVLDKEYKFIRAITTFQYKGKTEKFKNPNGIFVSLSNEIYVADTDNYRIIIFDPSGEVKEIFYKPDADLVDEAFQYMPLKITADKYGRIYVVSRGCTDGLIQLDSDGSFLKYYGAIKTSPNIIDVIWRRFQTKEQLARTTLNVPTVYSNVSIDESNFIYTTVSASGGVYDPNIMVRRINSMGIDILRRDGFAPPQGDIKTKFDIKTRQLDNSRFVDVAVRDYGIYGVLDVNMGRIFTYDYYGKLLYVFGAYGEQTGSFGIPEALCFSNNKYLILDSKFNHILIFAETEYAAKIDKATKLQFQRKYDEAQNVWGEILQLTSKSSLVYDGLGRMAIKNQEYNKAMNYFELADNKGYYSEAFGYYRKQLMSTYFGLSLTISILVAISLYLFWTIYKMVKKRRK